MGWDGRVTRLYVSKYGGNDTNDGLTESNPLRTIRAAVHKFEKLSDENKLVIIAPGSYDENVSIRRFREGKIILQALDKNNPPIVDSLQCEECETVEISNLNISEKNSVGLVLSHCESVLVESLIIRSTKQGITIDECDRVKISRCRISNAINLGVTIADSTVRMILSSVKDAAIGIVSNTSIFFSRENDITCAQKYQSNGSHIIE